MPLTSQILSLTRRLQPQPEAVTQPPGYQMFNDGGVEIEVAEFLYSLVRMIKPDYILETGTHLGISSTYMACGCRANAKGVIWTYEIISPLLEKAKLLWCDVGVAPFISSNLISSLEAVVPPSLEIDLLLLDSEPHLRFDEFLKFWDYLVPGAFIVIHDLHATMGHSDQTINGVYDWPYGDFRPKLGPFMKKLEVQVFHFPTPRGLTIFQKTPPYAHGINYLKDELL